MDEEVITWNLKGPKRMKKRKELNALIKNTLKYKSLLKKNSSMDAFNMNSCGASGGSGAGGRLLNYSTSDDEDYYFSANKSTIRERNKSYFCKIFQMIIMGCFITFCLLIGIILLFSYSKFHDILNDLKKEVDLQNGQNQKNFNGLKTKIDQYDSLFKQLKDKFSSSEAINNNTNRQSDILENNIQNLRFKKDTSNTENEARSIQSIDLTNRLNTYLIEWLFNNTISEKTSRQKSKINDKIEKSDILRRFLSQTNNQNPINFDAIVSGFFKNNDQIRDYIKFDDFSNIDLYFEKMQNNLKQIVLLEIENRYLKPIMETINKCNCPIKLAENESKTFID